MTRSLTIKTNPSGALVYVNDQLKGTSPLTYDFMWYGSHRLMLRKEGYQRLDDQKLLRSPVYLWIPFDLILELMPFRIRDARTWAYALTPSPALPTPMPPAVVQPEQTTSESPPKVGEQASPEAEGGGMPPAVAPVTNVEPVPTAQPVAEPAQTDPVTEPTHGTR